VKRSPPAPPKRRKQFPVSIKEGKIHVKDPSRGNRRRMEVETGVPDGIIAHRTRKYGENMQDCHVVDVTSGSFEKETHGASRHSGAYDNDPRRAAKNAADLENYHPFFLSAWRSEIFSISGTIGSATTSRREGSYQPTTQSSEHTVVIRAVVI
jgi:hypothetical protein